MPERRNRATTIRDIASAASVSTATVSHVINETRFVSAEVRNRVLNAIKETSYRPNAAARTLRGGGSGLLGMLVPNSSNPFFAEVVKAFEETSAGKGYSVLLSNCDRGDAQQRESVRVLAAQRVDGFALLLTNPEDDLVSLIKKETQAPVLSLDVRASKNDLVVRDNSYEGGALAAEYLWESGRRDFAVMAGPSGHQRMQERLVGVERFLSSKSIELPPSSVLHSSLDFDGGAEVGEEICAMHSKSDAPFGVISFNDAMAIGALRVFHDRGIGVPADIAVVGYDNIALGKHSVPSLTTISQDGPTLGRRASEALIECLISRDVPNNEIVIEPSLVIRESA